MSNLKEVNIKNGAAIISMTELNLKILILVIF